MEKDGSLWQLLKNPGKAKRGRKRFKRIKSEVTKRLGLLILIFVVRSRGGG